MTLALARGPNPTPNPRLSHTLEEVKARGYDVQAVEDGRRLAEPALDHTRHHGVRPLDPGRQRCLGVGQPSLGLRTNQGSRAAAAGRRLLERGIERLGLGLGLG